MAKYFLETSAFVKRYKKEEGSNFIKLLFQENHQLFYLNLMIMEVHKIFYRLYKWPQLLEKDISITKEEFEKLNSYFASDLLKMHRIDFTQETVEMSTEILEMVWIKSVFDLAHLSSFLMTKEIYSDLIFVCSDKRSNLIEAAKVFINPSDIKIPENET